MHCVVLTDFVHSELCCLDRVRFAGLGVVKVHAISRCQWPILILSLLSVVFPASQAMAGRGETHTTGRESVSSVRHDWKKDALGSLQAKKAATLAIPAHFGQLSPEARLAFLHERRNLSPTQFDHFHPHLGPLLAADDRMRAAQSQNCRPMNGILPDNALTRYLNFRRSLEPTRFDQFHPSLGAILVENHQLKMGQGCVAGEILVPPTPIIPPVGNPAAGPPIGGGPLPARFVPEPSSIVLLTLGTATLVGPIALRRWNPRKVSTD